MMAERFYILVSDWPDDVINDWPLLSVAVRETAYMHSVKIIEGPAERSTSILDPGKIIEIYPVFPLIRLRAERRRSRRL